MKKKKNRRNSQKHPDLYPRYNLKSRGDLLDQDYLHKLNPAELDWLNKFNREYVNDHLDRKNVRKNLHDSVQLIRDCDARNNARNADILTRAKASNSLIDFETLYEETAGNDYEDKIIHELDKKELQDAVDWAAKTLKRDEKQLEIQLLNEQRINDRNNEDQ